jgi:hypothetical protein
MNDASSKQGPAAVAHRNRERLRGQFKPRSRPPKGLVASGERALARRARVRTGRSVPRVGVLARSRRARLPRQRRRTDAARAPCEDFRRQGARVRGRGTGARNGRSPSCWARRERSSAPAPYRLAFRERVAAVKGALACLSERAPTGGSASTARGRLDRPPRRRQEPGSGGSSPQPRRDRSNPATLLPPTGGYADRRPSPSACVKAGRKLTPLRRLRIDPLWVCEPA